MSWESGPPGSPGRAIGVVIGALYAAGLNAVEIEAIFDDFAGSELDALTGIMRSGLDFSDLFSRLLKNSSFRPVAGHD